MRRFPQGPIHLLERFLTNAVEIVQGHASCESYLASGRASLETPARRLAMDTDQSGGGISDASLRRSLAVSFLTVARNSFPARAASRATAS